MLVVAVTAVCGKAIYDLLNISQSVYEMTASRTMGPALGEYARRRDQVGSLARIFRLLISRNRARNDRQIRRMKREERAREESILIEQEKVKSRQSVLDVIGHEIRSPLQSLLSKTDKEAYSDLRQDLERIRRAVDDWSLVSSAEAGLKGATIVAKRADIAQFLVTLARNLADKGVHYAGKSAGVFAHFDGIALDQVLGSLLDNAFGHRSPGTPVEISLYDFEKYVRVEVFNIGLNVPDDQVAEIFKYGVSSRTSPTHRGIGLFVARLNVVGMSGALHAHNRPNGVAFILTLPTSSDRT